MTLLRFAVAPVCEMRSRSSRISTTSTSASTPRQALRRGRAQQPSEVIGCARRPSATGWLGGPVPDLVEDRDQTVDVVLERDFAADVAARQNAARFVGAD